MTLQQEPKVVYIEPQSIQYSKEEWFEDVRSKSDSIRSKNAAACSVRMFELYCKHEGINQENWIKQCQYWIKGGMLEAYVFH